MNMLKNQLLGALVGLARASESKEISESAGDAFVTGLAMASESETALSADAINAMIDRLHEEKALMAPDCAACQYPCGRTFDYEMEEVYHASESLRDAKLQLIQALCKIASLSPANKSKENRQFLSDALFQISCTYSPEQLAGPLAKAASILENSHQIS